MHAGLNCLQIYLEGKRIANPKLALAKIFVSFKSMF